ncbi:MAG: class I SAM-dependent methyltransferase [Actinomycetota bacterium]|nr:class I SAM-dependent methyltransferase [Actinomycetota bacterium]
MPRFSIRRTLAVGSLRAFLRLEVGVGQENLGPLGGAERLADGLRKARRTSQKRAERIRALKAELAELRAARAKDARLLDYLLSDAFERRGPWVTGARVHGKTYGRAARDASPRLREFFRAFPEASKGRVLEPGSLEGAMTLELAKRAREVVGLEARAQSVERAEFLKGLFGAQNATFHVTNLEEDDLSSYGAFDAVFCCGLLYHLPNPRAFVERLAQASPNLYLDTQYARPEWDLSRREGLWGWVREEDPSDPRMGVSGTAFWPTLDELLRLLSESGYGRVETLSLPPDNRHGPRAHLAASRS